MSTFIRWKKFEEKCDEKPESEKEYLVCYGYDKDLVKGTQMVVATYYNKGDKIKVTAKEGADVPELKLTAEEKLLNNIFGVKQAEATIHSDGFYIMECAELSEETKEIAEEEYPGCHVFPNCIGSLEMIENEKDEGFVVFYAELPIAPKGYTHPYDYGEAFNDMITERKKRIKEETREFYNMTVDTNEELKSYYEALGDWKNFKDPDTDLYWSKGLCYEIDEDSVKRTLVLIDTVVTVGKHIISTYTSDELKELLENAKKINGSIQFTDFMDKLYTEAGIDRETDKIRFRNPFARMLVAERFVNAYAHDITPGYSWYEEFCNRVYSTHKMSEVYITVKATIMWQLAARLFRIAVVTNMGAPDIILRNEYRKAFETGYGFFNNDVKPARDFGRFYGITYDGKNCEYDPADHAWFVKEETDPEYEAECKRRLENKEYTIIRNAVECKFCGDEIESTDENEVVKCSCGKCVISGGLKELKYDMPEDAYIDKCILDLGNVPHK